MKSYKQILEDSYASDYKVKKFLGPDGKWQDRKLRPHRVDFKNSKMRGEPSQDDDRGDVGMKEEKTTGATKLVHTRTGANGAKYHIMQDSPTDYSIHREHKGKTTHIDTYGSLHRAKSVLDNEVKEEVQIDEAGYGRNRGYSHGFASPHAPSLGGRREREDDEGWDREPQHKPADAPHAVHINGKKWKSFGSKSHAQNVANKIKGATVHKEETNMTIDEQINEVLSKDATAGDWIHDFVHSDNPKFEGKSKDKRKQMALAAYYAKQQNEEVKDEYARKVDKHLKNKYAPVAPVPDRKYIKGTPENKAYKASKKPINGHPTNVKEGTMKSFKEMVQSLDELSKGTLGSYIKKAKGEAIGAANAMGMTSQSSKVHQSAEKKMVKRASGVNKAVDRLTNEEVEQIEEKSEQAKRNKTMKNMMDASRGARYKVQNKVSADDVRDWDGKHPTPRAQNVAIGRALRNEEKKEDPPFDGPYTKSPGTVKDKSGAVHTPMSRARDLARQAMKKQMKEDIDLFFEAKDESEYGYEGDMAMTQLKTMCRHAEEFMGMLKPDTDLPEWVQSKITLATDYIQTAHDYMSSEMNEELKGSQHKLDKNKNGKVDSHDFKILRGEVCTDCGKSPCECGTVKESDDVETRNLSFRDFISQLNEYTPGPGGVTRVQGRSYGAQYRDPEGEDDADDKKKQVAKPEPAVKRGRGRPAGSKSGANQKVTTGRKGSGVDYTGYKLHLPNSNR